MTVHGEPDRGKTVMSEDPNAGYATPTMDLLAAAVLAVLAGWMVVESLRLPIPGGLATAPGLLPFMVSASLLLMAGLLGYGALRRRRDPEERAQRFELPENLGRSTVLAAILLVYVAALDLIEFRLGFEIASLRFVLGVFEVVNVIGLTAILRIFWGEALWKCALISLLWTAFLSVVFRMIFLTSLP